MKVPLITGKPVETDNMSDRDAALHEAINNFYLVCAKFNATSLAKVILQNENGLSMLYVPNDTDEIRAQEYTKLISSLSDWITKTSNGRLILVDTWESDEPSKDENE